MYFVDPSCPDTIKMAASLGINHPGSAAFYFVIALELPGCDKTRRCGSRWFALLDKPLWRSLNYAIPNRLARLSCRFSARILSTAIIGTNHLDGD